MRQILDRTLERQLTTLELLWDGEWHATHEIAHTLHYALKTLNTDVHRLNTFIAPLWIETSTKHGIRLQGSQSFSKKILYSLILKQSLSFQVIESAFFQPVTTTSQLAKNNYTSIGTIKRTIHHVNACLNEQGIHLETNGHFKGDHYLLSHIIANLITEKYETAEAFLPIDENDLITQLVFEFVSENEAFFPTTIFSFEGMNQVKIMVYIAIHQIKKGVTFSWLKKESSIVTNCLKDTVFVENFKKTFGIHLDEETLKKLFSPYFHFNFPANYRELEKNVTLDKQAKKNIRKIELLIEILEERFNVSCSDKQALLLQIYQDWQLNYQLKKPLYDKSQFYFETLASELVIIQEELSKAFAMESVADWLMIPQQEYVALLFEICTYWQELISAVRNSRPVLQACLICNDLRFNKDYLKTKLEARLKNFYQIDIPTSFSLKELEKEAHHYDCFITNINFYPEFQTDVIVVSDTLNEMDFNRLIDYYQQKTAVVY